MARPMLCDYDNIPRLCQPPAGSLKAIQFFDPDSLTEQPVWYALPNFEALSFPSGTEPFVIEADKLTGIFTEKVVTNSAAGDYYEGQLNCTVRGVRLDVEYIRRKMRNRRVHVLVTYQDDLQRFVPNMRLSIDSTSGDKGSKNAYTIQGAARYLTPAPTINSVLTPPGGGGGGGGEDPMNAPVTLTVTGSTTSYAIAAGMLLTAIVIIGDTSQTIDIGTTPGGSDITDDFDCVGGEAAMLGSINLYSGAGKTIYFSNLTGNNTIKIYLW